MDDDMRAMLAAQHAEISARIEELEERKARLREALLAEGDGTRAAGPLKVIVTTSRKLDIGAFALKYSPSEFPGYWEPKPRTALAKALGDDSVYIDGPTSVRVMEA